MPHPPTKTANVFVGVDALRGIAAVAVVMLHACVPYSRPTMAGLSWSVTTESTSASVTALFWAIEIVIMPIFLVIAGFFAARSFTSRGAWPTAAARTRRLGKALLLSIIFLLPIEFYIWMLGWLAEEHVTVSEVRRLKFAGDVDENLWGLSHLWFLPYLVSYIALTAWTWSAIARCPAERLVRWALPGCFLIAVVALTLRPEIVWGFQHAFLPVPSKWIYSGVFFAAGVFWFRIDPDFSKLAARSSRMLGPAILLTTFCVVIGSWWLTSIGDPGQWLAGGWAEMATSGDRVAGTIAATTLPIGGFLMRSSLAIFTVGAAALLTFSLIGVSQSRIHRLGPALSSLAGASFLIYLLHHPVVGLAHVAARFALPSVAPEIKVAMVTSIGVGAGWSVSWLLSRHQQRVAQRTAVADEVETIAFPRPNELPGTADTSTRTSKAA